MEILKNLYNLLNTQMIEPTTFGAYHIACIVAAAIITFITCKLFKDCSDRTVRRISGVVWVIILLFEIYKQLIHGIELNNGRFAWDYAWYIFPFQFCSSPLYVLPIIAFARNEKLRDCCVAYMMTFSLFAGLAVFCYPNDVFVETMGVNIQTMVHHGSQILMGVFFAVRYRDRYSKGFFLGGSLVFVVMTAIALALNVAVYNALIYFGINETFNMFFISPYFDCTLPVLSLFWNKMPYIGFLCLYFFGFIFCAVLVYGIFHALVKNVRGRALGVR